MVNRRYFFLMPFMIVVTVFHLLYPLTSNADCNSDWLAQNPASGTITSQETSDIECILNWFETSFADVFYPSSNTIFFGSLAYRYYSGSNAYLGAWKTTSLKFIYLGPLSGNCIMELGAVDFWKAMVCNTNSGITPGLWAGSIVEFFVSSDGADITSSGSSIIKNGMPCSFVLGPVAISNVGYCGNINLTINTSGNDIPIVNNTFAFSTNEGMMVYGSFLSGTSASGTYSVNEYIPYCGGYAVGSGNWNAIPFGSYKIGSKNQSNRQNIATENTIADTREP